MSFLLSVQKPNLVAFEITTCEMAYGPSWSTNWTVLDMAETNGLKLIRAFARPITVSDHSAVITFR